MNFLIALSVNLAGMLVIYSLLACALARLSWRRRGVIGVLAAIVIAVQFWIVPILFLPTSSYPPTALPLALGFCNWLISGLSVMIFCHSVRRIPRQLEDSARLDGCGWFGIYWHVILPRIKRELCVIAFLTLLATASLGLSRVEISNLSFQWFPIGEGFSGLAQSVSMTMSGSLMATLPVIAVFLFAKGRLLEARNPAE